MRAQRQARVAGTIYSYNNFQKNHPLLDKVNDIESKYSGAEAIKNARKYLEMTQTDLESAVGFRAGAVSLIELGRQPARRAQWLAVQALVQMKIAMEEEAEESCDA